jgi:hypothetical protein
MHAVRVTATHATTPDAEMGYGIPDMLAAHEFLLATVGITGGAYEASLQAFPVPFAEELWVAVGYAYAGPWHVELHDMAGRRVVARSGSMAQDGRLHLGPEIVAALTPGAYMLSLEGDGIVQRGAVIKQL